MLSLERAALRPTGIGQARMPSGVTQGDKPNRVYVLEIDLGAGRVTVEGRVDMHYLPEGWGTVLTSAATGRIYREAVMVGDVEVWKGSLDRYLMIFADHAAMRAGGREFAGKYADRLTVGLYRMLTEGE